MKKLLLFLILLMCCNTAFAGIPADWQSPADLVGGAMDDALKQITSTLEKAVISIIFALALLQATITGIKQLASGEVDKTIINFAMIVSWVGLALWLLGTATSPVKPGISNLSDILYWMQNFALSIVSTMTGGIEFSASKILEIGLQAYGYITLSVAKTTSTNLVNALATILLPGVGLVTGLMVFFISVVVMVSCAYLAIKVFITKIEFAILVAIAPLNAAFLVFAPTREQGWAPFKGALSLIYRILILGGVVAAIGKVSEYLGNYVDAQAYGISADVWTPLLSGAFAFALLAFIAHKSDSIASAMASGTSSMSSGDLAGSIATGVAAGMAGGAAAGAIKAAATGGTGVKSMTDFMKNLSSESPTARGIDSIKKSLGLNSEKPDAPVHQQPKENPADKYVPGKTPPDRKDYEPKPPVTNTNAGAGTNAGIGGKDSQPGNEGQEKMIGALNKMVDRGSNLNRKLESDSSTTSVHINSQNIDH